MRLSEGRVTRRCQSRVQRFVDFADTAGATYVTTDLALAWATQPANVQPAQWANRLGQGEFVLPGIILETNGLTDQPGHGQTFPV